MHRLFTAPPVGLPEFEPATDYYSITRWTVCVSIFHPSSLSVIPAVRLLKLSYYYRLLRVSQMHHYLQAMSLSSCDCCMQIDVEATASRLDPTMSIKHPRRLHCISLTGAMPFNGIKHLIRFACGWFLCSLVLSRELTFRSMCYLFKSVIIKSPNCIGSRSFRSNICR